MGQVMGQGEAPPPVVLVPPLFERDLRLRVSYTCMQQCALAYLFWVHVRRQWMFRFGRTQIRGVVSVADSVLHLILQTRMAHSSYDYMFGKPAMRFLMNDYLQVVSTACKCVALHVVNAGACPMQSALRFTRARGGG